MLAQSTNAIIGKPLITLNSVDSTNNYAMQALKKGMAEHGTAYFAYEQTAGKGQRNKQWLSNKGENIILSIVLNAQPLAVNKKFYLNIISALAVKNLFNKYSTDIFKIKWPNDVYFRDRKAAGILIENIIKGDIINYSVTGFGININQTNFDAALKNPVSLKQITGKNYDVISLAEELCALLAEQYQQLMNGNTETLLNEYNQSLYKKNALAKFKKDDIVFEGSVVGVNDSGRLIIKSLNETVELETAEWIIE